MLIPFDYLYHFLNGITLQDLLLATSFLPILKVGENKVVSNFILEVIWLSYNHLVYFEISLKATMIPNNNVAVDQSNYLEI